MDQVKVGILGTSWWADAMYLPALRNHPKARVEAVAGRNPETTRAFASRWEIQQDYENAEELYEHITKKVHSEGCADVELVAVSESSGLPLTINV